MPIVLGSFETQTQAEEAMDRLRGIGFGNEDFSLISHAQEEAGAPMDEEQVAGRKVDTAMIGGAIGAVLGGFLLGPVGAVVGGVAAGGGLTAALGGLGVNQDEATEYQRRLHAGRYVLAVRDDGRTDEVRRVLSAAGADDVEVEH